MDLRTTKQIIRAIKQGFPFSQMVISFILSSFHDGEADQTLFVQALII